MICKSCGRTIGNENANFCDYCGTSLREQSYPEIDTAEVHPNEMEAVEGEKPISFGNWLGSMGLLFIPVIGGVVYAGMLIYWSLSDKVTESKKNWARATLIMVVLWIILMVFYFERALQQLTASGFDINSYMQQLYSGH